MNDAGLPLAVLGAAVYVAACFVALTLDAFGLLRPRGRALASALCLLGAAVFGAGLAISGRLL